LSSPLPVGQALAFDAVRSPGKDLEPPARDLLATPDAYPICASGDPRQGLVDEPQLVIGAIVEGKIALLGEDLAGGSGLRAIGHLAGRDDRLSEILDEASALGVKGSSGGFDMCLLHASNGTCVSEVQKDHDYPQGKCSNTRSFTMAIEIDPVCGMEVDTTTSLLSLPHDGKTYWFCSKGCMLEFRDDPEKYLAPDYKPSM
jgi:YHS domain-containing protein